MRMCNAKKQKRSAKGSNFKDDDKAYFLQELLLYALPPPLHVVVPGEEEAPVQPSNTLRSHILVLECVVVDNVNWGNINI